MTTDLADFITNAQMIDTHEHMRTEQVWVEDGPDDVLRSLFESYVCGDLVSAGAEPRAMDGQLDAADGDIEGRWSGVEDAWRAIEHTGYGQAVRIAAKDVFGIDEITPDTVRAAQPKLDELRQPGERLRILRDLAKLDHIQTDNGIRTQLPDASGPGFFFYDISWVGFVYRGVDWDLLERETDVAISDLDSLEQAMRRIFELHGKYAVAVKTQHAYNRTLCWQKRDRADAERAFARFRRDLDHIDEEARLCFGDWALARGCELAGEFHLPVKIHCGYYAGNGSMVTDRIRAGNLCPLLIEYPDTRFVLMHIAYPYSDELIAMAKHFRNVWADLCWAWSLNPVASADFVRRFIHAAPASKLFAFGGDTKSPTDAYAFSIQMRRYLTKALETEVEEGELTEAQAIAFAQRIMYENQMQCFDVEATRTANVEALTAAV